MDTTGNQAAASMTLRRIALEWMVAEDKLRDLESQDTGNGSSVLKGVRSRLRGCQDALTATWRLVATAEGIYTPPAYTIPDWFATEYPDGTYTDPETGHVITVDPWEHDDSMEFYRSSDLDTVERAIIRMAMQERAVRAAALAMI